MIIDLICERKENDELGREDAYNAKKFLDDVISYDEVCAGIGKDIIKGFSSNDEAKIQNALCKYIDEQKYNEKLKEYIESVNWLNDSREKEEVFEYKYNSFDNAYTVISCKNREATNVHIPSTYNGKPVTTISNCAFYKMTNLKTVTGMENVNYISINAFSFCSNLEEVIGANNVTSIGDCAFMGCTNLRVVKGMKRITAIGVGAFCKCKNLVRIENIDTVDSIGAYAFDECDKFKNVCISKNCVVSNKAFAKDCKVTYVENKSEKKNKKKANIER